MSLGDAPPTPDCSTCPSREILDAHLGGFDLDTYLIKQLGHIEARPEMWAQHLEALVATYIASLDTLRILRGWNPDEAENKDHTFRRWVRVSAVPHGPQNCVTIWERDGNEDMTHDDVIVLLRKLREEVLG